MKQYEIQGMTCNGCVRRIVQQVEQVEGVADAQASVETGLLSVQGTPSPESIIEAVEKAGYRAQEI